jgi:NAD(P)-dependent dehydrogenase (short-subunit alcohol dehydrogenase family)
MDKKITKVAVITGGTGGIGYHLSMGFQQAGYTVIAIDYSEHKKLPEGILYMGADLSLEADVIKAFEDIKRLYGPIHILINNAAISQFNKSIRDISLHEFDQVMNVNLRGTFLCSKLFIEANRGENYGRIINIASTRWHQNEANWEAYGASKGGMISLTNTLCVSLSDTPITVNAISPGWIQNTDYAELSDTDHKQHPSGRVGKPDDILRACLFLADKKNDFINGHNLVVDGGMTKKMIYE